MPITQKPASNPKPAPKVHATKTRPAEQARGAEHDERVDRRSHRRILSRERPARDREPRQHGCRCATGSKKGKVTVGAAAPPNVGRGCAASSSLSSSARSRSSRRPSFRRSMPAGARLRCCSRFIGSTGRVARAALLRGRRRHRRLLLRGVARGGPPGGCSCPFAWEGRDVALTGWVAGLPQPTERGTRFVFDVEQVDTPGAVVPSHIALTWYADREGGRAAAAPRTRRAALDHACGSSARAASPIPTRSTSSPGRSSAASARRATCARKGGRPRAARTRASTGWPYTLHRWRMRDPRRDAGAPRRRAASRACSWRSRSATRMRSPPDDWEVFWRTGVGHLMSISGLHITMLAGLGFAIALLRCGCAFPRSRCDCPARKAAVVVGDARWRSPTRS